METNVLTIDESLIKNKKSGIKDLKMLIIGSNSRKSLPVDW